MRLIALFTLSLTLLSSPMLALSNEYNVQNERKHKGYWSSGIVKKRPYHADYHRIKVGKVTYILMPRCEILQRVFSPNGSYSEESFNPKKIKTGDEVLMFAHGNRITQLIVINRG